MNDIKILCSQCHDKLSVDGNVRGITPQSTCEACGRGCMGYGAILKHGVTLPAHPRPEGQ